MPARVGGAGSGSSGKVPEGSGTGPGRLQAQVREGCGRFRCRLPVQVASSVSGRKARGSNGSIITWDEFGHSDVVQISFQMSFR